MNVTIENEKITATIKTLGAELCSLQLKDHQQEYMWQADPSYWAKHSPVLFPFVGTLKNNEYHFKGRVFQCGRHGFAREREFDVETIKQDRVCFRLDSDESSKKIYPFDFEFRIIYSVSGTSLSVAYEILNKGEDTMYFSVGGHPAFAVPLTKNTQYEDYQLRFDQKENASRWPISTEGLIELSPVPLLNNEAILPLSRELFRKDALVFKNLQSNKIILESAKTERGLAFEIKGFPFLGLWAARDADFVCIEPWCGIADSTDSDQVLENKEGINAISPNMAFVRNWKVELF